MSRTPSWTRRSAIAARVFTVPERARSAEVVRLAVHPAHDAARDEHVNEQGTATAPEFRDSAFDRCDGVAATAAHAHSLRHTGEVRHAVVGITRVEPVRFELVVLGAERR